MSDPSPWLEHPPWGMADHLVARLERSAREVAAEWGLELGPRIVGGRYSYVAPAGPHAILKIIPVEDDDAQHIADALRLWNGDGAVRLLREDPARHALLIERAHPGTDAAETPEDEAIAAAIDVGRRMWRKPPREHPFRSVRDWVARWLPPDSAHELVPTARRVFGTLSIRTDVVVHADFHHHNLLRHGDRWVAIDPKPIIGEPEFDIPAFLYNPLGSVSTRARTERRIRSFADAGLDGDRIREWAIVRGVCDGLPIRRGKTEADRPQLRLVRELL